MCLFSKIIKKLIKIKNQKKVKKREEGEGIRGLSKKRYKVMEIIKKQILHDKTVDKSNRGILYFM